MGSVGEARKLVQDFLAPPELRGIKARLEGFETATQPRFDAVDARLKALEQVGAACHEAVMGALTHLSTFSGLAERLARFKDQNETRASH